MYHNIGKLVHVEGNGVGSGGSTTIPINEKPKSTGVPNNKETVPVPKSEAWRSIKASLPAKAGSVHG